MGSEVVGWSDTWRLRGPLVVIIYLISTGLFSGLRANPSILCNCESIRPGIDLGRMVGTKQAKAPFVAFAIGDDIRRADGARGASQADQTCGTAVPRAVSME